MDGQTPNRHRPVQFSLRALLVVTTVAAVLCALLMEGPPMVRWSTGFALFFLLPLLRTVMLAYGRGYQRTFAIGAMFPCGILLLSVGVGIYFYALAVSDGPRPTWEQVGRYLSNAAPALASIAGMNLVLSILFGVVALGLRWMIEPRR